MPEQNQENPLQVLLADFNTRLKEIEERNRVTKERVLLLGKNLLNINQDIESEFAKIKKDNLEIKRTLDDMKHKVDNISTSVENFVKRDEIAMIERMLKDFQPLEFARITDVQKIIEENKSTKQSIKRSDN